MVEVSGKEQLIFRGTVNVRASKGKAGVLLLDPASVAITAGALMAQMTIR